MQRACAILSSVACPALQYFSTLSQNRHDFRNEKVTEHTWVFYPHTCGLKHFSYWEEVGEVWSKIHIGLRVTYPLSLPGFKETWIFIIDFPKILKYQIEFSLDFPKILKYQIEFSRQIFKRYSNTKLNFHYRFSKNTQVSNWIFTIDFPKILIYIKLNFH